MVSGPRPGRQYCTMMDVPASSRISMTRQGREGKREVGGRRCPAGSTSECSPEAWGQRNGSGREFLLKHQGQRVECVVEGCTCWQGNGRGAVGWE